MKGALVIMVIVISVIAGAFGGYFASSLAIPSENDLIKEFYAVENAVHVSPHSLRKKIDSGVANFVLVDLRSQEEYEKEHIAGAINIPAYKDKDTSDYGAVERIVTAFAQLPKDKEIITYCYSIPCMTSRKIGKMLAENDIYVKALGIGWNEWRYFWTLWNHEHEWNQTLASDYVVSGLEPGVPKLRGEGGVCAVGQFGC
ncbi:MAG: rhodanese-like domain-containing protein [Candidatus Woesearchaeota archaeon]|nr:rhodanese-like domain-containing protein [Candidatus Woesearchaeota archaeon]